MLSMKLSENGICSPYFSINWWKPDFFQQQYDSQPKLHPLFFLARKCFKFRHAASASSLISPKWLGLRPLRISKDRIVFSDIEKRHGTPLATKKQSIFLEVSWDCHGGKWASRKCWPYSNMQRLTSDHCLLKSETLENHKPGNSAGDLSAMVKWPFQWLGRG